MVEEEKGDDIEKDESVSIYLSYEGLESLERDQNPKKLHDFFSIPSSKKEER